jgi:hypothetical protein
MERLDQREICAAERVEELDLSCEGAPLPLRVDLEAGPERQVLVGVAAHDQVRRYRLDGERPELAAHGQAGRLAVIPLLGAEAERPATLSRADSSRSSHRGTDSRIIEQRRGASIGSGSATLYLSA